MKKFKIGLLVFAVLVTAKTVSATTYNYLPPDVLIKQQEQQSALEYRLQKLEAGAANDPSAMISSLSSRISQLESQRTTEKNYISGVYGRNGLGDQLAGKLAEIDAKYSSQISDLQSQKSKLESSISTQQNNEKEISDLKLQIAQLKEKIADQELQVNQQAIQKYQTKETYSDADVLEVFTYIDALAVQDSSNLFQRIKKNNAEVAERLTALYNNKYPNGKPGTAKYDDYLKSIQKTIKPEVIKKEIKSTTQKTETKPIVETITTPVVQQPVVTPTPVQEKPSLGKRIKNFFTRWFK